MARMEEVFKSQHANPVLVEAALLSLFGTEWLDWDGDSLIEALRRHLRFEPSNTTKQKINALLVLHSNEAYWEDWRAFEGLNWALSGMHVDWAQMNPLTPMVLLYGLRTARIIDNKGKLSDEVRKYIISVFLTEQFSLMPVDLGFLQKELVQHRPDLKERADQVHAMLVNNKAVPSDTEDATAVELSKHRVLDAVLDTVATKEIILLQASKYGLDRMVQRFLGARA